MDGKENTFSIGVSNTMGYPGHTKECKMTRIFKITVKGSNTRYIQYANHILKLKEFYKYLKIILLNIIINYITIYI